MSLTNKDLEHCDRMLQPDWEQEYNYAGGFQTKLMRAIEHADSVNLRKIESIYPNMVKAYRKWSGKP